MSATTRIEIDNRARARIPTDAVKKVARAALRYEGVRGGELSILVTHDAAIRKLNKKWRRIDAPTNVLSFPGAGGDVIGDVIVSVDYCRRQGKETGAGFQYTFFYYLVHGILHLLGHDHLRPLESERMYTATERILDRARVRAG